MTKENEESAKHQKMESVLIGCQYPRTNKMQKMEKAKHYRTSFRKEGSTPIRIKKSKKLSNTVKWKNPQAKPAFVRVKYTYLQLLVIDFN